MELKLFDVFGSLRVEPTAIHVIAMGQSLSGRSIEKTYQLNLDSPIYDYSAWQSPVVIMFAATLADKKINTLNLAARAGGPDLSKEPAIKKALQETVKKFV